MKKFTIIAAMDEKRGIGYKGQLPWRLRGDLDHFRKITVGQNASGQRNAVIMGDRTWNSLPPTVRPLPDRLNVVLSFEPLDLPPDVIGERSLDGALTALDRPDIDQVFIIGGAMLYAKAIQHQNCERLLITEVNGTFPTDVSFPVIPLSFKEADRTAAINENGVMYQFVTYTRAY